MPFRRDGRLMAELFVYYILKISSWSLRTLCMLLEKGYPKFCTRNDLLFRERIETRMVMR